MKKIVLVLMRVFWVGSLDVLLSLLLLLARPARFVFKLGIIGLLLVLVMEGMNYWRDRHVPCRSLICMVSKVQGGIAGKRSSDDGRSQGISDFLSIARTHHGHMDLTATPNARRDYLNSCPGAAADAPAVDSVISKFGNATLRLSKATGRNALMRIAKRCDPNYGISCPC